MKPKNTLLLEFFCLLFEAKFRSDKEPENGQGGSDLAPQLVGSMRIKHTRLHHREIKFASWLFEFSNGGLRGLRAPFYHRDSGLAQSFGQKACNEFFC